MKGVTRKLTEIKMRHGSFHRDKRRHNRHKEQVIPQVNFDAEGRSDISVTIIKVKLVDEMYRSCKRNRTHLNANDLGRDRIRNLEHRRPALYRLLYQDRRMYVSLYDSNSGGFISYHRFNIKEEITWTNTERVYSCKCGDRQRHWFTLSVYQYQPLPLRSEREQEGFVGRRNQFLVQDEAITRDETPLHDGADRHFIPTTAENGLNDPRKIVAEQQMKICENWSSVMQNAPRKSRHVTLKSEIERTKRSKSSELGQTSTTAVDTFVNTGILPVPY
ncbi:hypothetical protein ANN_01046 [Periplaneta americana]|uniref:Uncharacterized protein n=1 Tax=Periplaneta americana TaxID=6978 RepID=A0ABQ8TVE1_PERAM|nr:hypothetical protein ANN_01046 [Periplaneta americana]